jgi:hypothetical protein
MILTQTNKNIKQFLTIFKVAISQNIQSLVIYFPSQNIETQFKILL